MLLTLLCPTLLLHYFLLQNCLNYFICHAFSVEIASEMVIDQYNHIIQQGEKYIACKYLEQLKEICGHIYIYLVINGSYGEILFIESVLSGTFFMRGQKHVLEKFVLKFYILWGQFASRNSLPCSTQYGRLKYFIKVSSTLLSRFLLEFKII